MICKLSQEGNNVAVSAYGVRLAIFIGGTVFYRLPTVVTPNIERELINIKRSWKHG